jgi:hypothetical protein
MLMDFRKVNRIPSKYTFIYTYNFIPLMNTRNLKKVTLFRTIFNTVGISNFYLLTNII